MSDSPASIRTPLLFQPFKIRGLTLKNRLVVPPMVHYRADPGATCGMFHQVHLGRYALGGFGLVFVEATGVEEIGLINEFDLGIWNEAQAESFKPLIAFMRRENTAIGIQLAHGGRKSSSQTRDGRHGAADARRDQGRRQAVAAGRPDQRAGRTGMADAAPAHDRRLPRHGAAPGRTPPRTRSRPAST